MGHVLECVIRIFINDSYILDSSLSSNLHINQNEEFKQKLSPLSERTGWEGGDVNGEGSRARLTEDSTEISHFYQQKFGHLEGIQFFI